MTKRRKILAIVGVFLLLGLGGWFYHVHQLLIQLLGVTVIGLWGFGATYALFSLLKATVGIRVTKEEELAGLDISEHGISAYTDMEYPLLQRMLQTLPVMEESLQLDEETASPV